MPPAFEKYQPLVDKFLTEIQTDFRILEAVASRGSTIRSQRELAAVPH